MAFENDERSIEDGRPIQLYRFAIGGNFWYYTNADDDIEKVGQLWKAIAITDDGVNQTGEAASDALTLTTTTDIVVSQMYQSYPPSRPVQVAIFQAHEESDNVRALYVGEVTQHNIPRPGTAVFTCETIAATMAREGLRLGWQRTCPYALYDPVTCKVDKALFAVAGTVGAVVDNIVTIAALSAHPTGRFDGGFIEWTDPVRGIERRGIETHNDDEITMFGTADGIETGMSITAYPGCPRTTTGCTSFGNIDNYGGAPGMQGKSPFDGTPVFN
jgi:uncharacterized phage protein (TIGR02218 family)